MTSDSQAVSPDTHAQPEPRPRRGVIDRVITVPTIALICLFISVVKTPQTLPEKTICPLRALTGKPCPGCGLTRAFCEMSHGHARAAVAYNPFVLLFYPLCVCLATLPLWRRWCPGVVIFFGRPDIIVGAMIVVGVSMMVFGIIRVVITS